MEKFAHDSNWFYLQNREKVPEVWGLQNHFWRVCQAFSVRSMGTLRWLAIRILDWKFHTRAKTIGVQGCLSFAPDHGWASKDFTTSQCPQTMWSQKMPELLMTLDRCVLGFINFRSSISLFASECYQFRDYLLSEKVFGQDRNRMSHHWETGLRPGLLITYWHDQT